MHFYDFLSSSAHALPQKQGFSCISKVTIPRPRSEGRAPDRTHGRGGRGRGVRAEGGAGGRPPRRRSGHRAGPCVSWPVAERNEVACAKHRRTPIRAKAAKGSGSAGRLPACAHDTAQPRRLSERGGGPRAFSPCGAGAPAGETTPDAKLINRTAVRNELHQLSDYRARGSALRDQPSEPHTNVGTNESKHYVTLPSHLPSEIAGVWGRQAPTALAAGKG